MKTIYLISTFGWFAIAVCTMTDIVLINKWYLAACTLVLSFESLTRYYKMKDKIS